LTCHDQIYFEERFLDEVGPVWESELQKINALIPVKYEIDDDIVDDMSAFGIFEI